MTRTIHHDLPVLRKARRPGEPTPNLVDYDRARREFSWAECWASLDGLPGGGVNIAHETVDRHAAGPLRDKIAIRWLGKDGSTRSLTYGALSGEASRFANALQTLSVQPGDRVFVLTGRIPELYVAALGTLKHRAIFAPLFSAFGPEPIRQRIAIGSPRVLVTTERLYRKKIEPLRGLLPDLEHVIVIGEGDRPARPNRPREARPRRNPT